MGKKALGELIASARKAQGVSYYDLAERLGKQPPTINQIEHGRNYPSLLLTCELIRALNIDPRDAYYAIMRDDE